MTPPPTHLLHELVVPDRHPAGAVALHWQDRAITFAQLHRRIDAVAAAVSADTAPGDRVAVLSWNRPEVLELLYGVPAAGRIVVPLNARLHPAELRAQLEQVDAAWVIGEPELLETVTTDRPRLAFGSAFEAWLTRPRPGRGVAPDGLHHDDPAWIIFTSGSTGRPKGAMLSHRSLLAAVASAAGARPVAADDSYLYPFPLFHVSAHNVLIQHRHGRPVVLLPGFDAGAVLEACPRHAVTTMSLAPTMMAMLLDHPAFERDALATVRTIGYGASAIAEPLLRRVLAEVGVGLSQGYGATELSGNACFLDAADHRRAIEARPDLLGSAGRAAPGVELRLASDGELLVRGDQVMLGYWNEPELSATTVVDGWLHTGDLGRLDDDGYLFVVDRKKDLIISGGENIASREVEAVLLDHASVAAAAVIGVPDEQWGEAVCAIVVLRPGTEPDADALVLHCRGRLAGYKRPRRVLFRPDLPVNANGKVDKPALRQWAVGR